MKNEYEIVIVGSGICGLSLGTLLSDQGKISAILEKSNSVGGRLATRRNDDSVFDHGAQFYKFSKDRSIFWHQQMQDQSVTQFWFKDEKGTGHFYGSKGMTQIAKALQKTSGIVHFSQRLMRFFKQEDRLILECESGDLFSCDKLVLTCPLPQTLEILRASQIKYPEALDQIVYAKALVGLFEIRTQALLKKTESSSRQDFCYPKNEIFSIADNRMKSISKSSSFTVVMNPKFSEDHFEAAEEQVLNQIQALFLEQLDVEAEVKFKQLKKWRYSHPLSTYPDAFHQVIAYPEVFLAGDAFGGASTFGAVRSAEALSKLL